MKVSFVENSKLSKIFSSKPQVGQNVALHALCMCMCVCVCVCVSVHLLHNYAWILADIYILIFLDNIFHLDVHYVCMLVQCFEPQGRHFTNFHYHCY